MLAPRIARSAQQPVWVQGTTPEALEAAADALLAAADGVSLTTIRNRDLRAIHRQGPSFDLLENIADAADEEDSAYDLPMPVGRARWGEDEEEEREEGAEEGQDAIDTYAALDQGLGYAVSGIYHTDTRVRRGAPARGVGGDVWNAICSLYPCGGPWRDVLILSAQHGAGASEKIGEMLGLSGRRVRRIQDNLLAWAAAHLDPAQIRDHLDDPITKEQVARRTPSRAGRTPKAVAGRVPRVLVLVERVATPPRTPRPYKQPRPRAPRRRFVDPNQTDMFTDMLLEIAA